jgi:hypothetical protein
LEPLGGHPSGGRDRFSTIVVVENQALADDVQRVHVIDGIGEPLYMSRRGAARRSAKRCAADPGTPVACAPRKPGPRISDAPLHFVSCCIASGERGQRVLEAAGVEFTNGDAPGVRLRKKKR